MATYTTDLHDEGQNTAQSKLGEQTVYDRFTVSTALAINDVVRSVYIPKNAILLDALVAVEELDTGADAITLTLRANDGTTQQNFFAASTVGQAGGIQRADAIPGAVGYQVATEGFFLELLVAAGPGAGATAVDIVFEVKYTMNRIHAD